MSENEISKIIVDISYKIHTQLGPGLLESVYETILDYELTSRGLKVERQKSLPVKQNRLSSHLADILAKPLVDETHQNVLPKSQSQKADQKGSA